MLPLLASADTAPLQLPLTYQGLSVVALGGLMMIALTAGVVIAGFQRLRSALTKEMKLEMESQAKVLAVQVQQPLAVQVAKEFVTTAAHKEAIEKIEAELRRHAGRRAEIYETQKEQGEQLSALNEKTDLMNAQLQRQDGKIDRILERLPRQ